MGPLRSLGEALLYMSTDEIRPIQVEDFEASLVNIRPSVSKEGLQEYENWAKEFGEKTEVLITHASLANDSIFFD